ncbi:MAG: hypothetical protein CMK89_02220 [Pseudomonadales bacterium]|nr:hypothetical protein [Pseudomonadales bacterium]
MSLNTFERIMFASADKIMLWTRPRQATLYVRLRCPKAMATPLHQTNASLKHDKANSMPQNISKADQFFRYV